MPKLLRTPAARARRQAPLLKLHIEGLHQSGHYSADIATALTAWRLFNPSGGRHWDTHEVRLWLRRRRMVPNEDWFEAHQMNEALDVQAERRRESEEYQRERDRETLIKQRQRVVRLGGCLNRAFARLILKRRQRVARAERRLRLALRAVKVSQLPLHERGEQLAKAARAREGQQQRSDAYLRRLGHVVLTMRQLHFLDEAIIAELDKIGLRPARAKAWTRATVAGIATCTKRRLQVAPDFVLDLAGWAPPSKPARPPPEPLPPDSFARARAAAARHAEEMRAFWAEQERQREEAARAARADWENRQREKAIRRRQKIEAGRAGKSDRLIAAGIARSARGSAVASEQARAARAVAWALVRPRLEAGATLSEVARELNENGVPRLRGGSGWTKAAVSQLIRATQEGKEASVSVVEATEQ
ncbi:hypothetical protein [Lichenicoccus sp.]|uniref:hypothetical protein n=1 Tax=Lichenicoccus sp. TaxID=2781899 RepID=UPI003D0B6A63